MADVVTVAEETKYVRPAESVVNYHPSRCNAVHRHAVALQLDRGVVPVKWGQLMRQSSLQWAVAEVKYRVPLPAVSLAVLTVSESRAVLNMDPAVHHEGEELQILRADISSHS